MRRWIGSFALLALAATLAPAQLPEVREPRFEPAEVVSTVEPRYPAKSIATGTVILQVSLNETGAIEQVKVLKHVASLTAEAERAVRHWSFRPARLNGRPVRSSLAVAFTFRTVVQGSTFDARRP